MTAPQADPLRPRRIDPRLIPWARRVLREQPALGLTLGYLVLALLGMGYQWTLFRQFDIDVLEYAEISDFLLAALRAPVVIVFALLPVPILWALDRMEMWLRRSFPRYARLSGRADRPMGYMVSYSLVIAVYYLLFAALWTDRIERRMREGRGTMVTVERVYSGGGVEEMEVALLGRTNSYMFFFDAERNVTHAIPIDNIARITTADVDEEEP